MKLIKITNSNLTTKVDDKVYEWLNQYRWHIMVTGGSSSYLRVIRYANNKTIRMHREVMKYYIMKEPDEQVDHINHDTLDNRIENLRICTHSQNKMNSKKYKNNTSGFKGVVKTRNGNWRAEIWANRKRISLGTYKKKVEAVYARKAGEGIYHGEFAFLAL